MSSPDPDIERPPASKRRATSFDIAALAGVSQPTVSRALSGNSAVSAETRARVMAAAEQLHYIVDRHASSLRSRSSLSIDASNQP